jgi:hypothetical protein
MSGTDFTLTANYQLFKPNYNADVGGWGSHLNSNADKIDALFATAGIGGSFLPLSGGTVTGATSFTGFDTNTNGLLVTYGALVSGALTAAGAGTGLAVTNNASLGAGIAMPGLHASPSYANDAAAATGGVQIGWAYRNGSQVMIRMV